MERKRKMEFEQPQQLKIAFRPHCSFHLKEEYTSSSGIFSFMSNLRFDCDFCSQEHTGYRYCCYLCNFHICGGCADLFIIYHDGKEHREHISHQHPLVPLNVEEQKCNMCWKGIHGESYACVPCEFFIHKSCSELSQQVLHPFHPRHYLALRENSPFFTKPCQGCGFHIGQSEEGKPGKWMYRCDKCQFNMHLECMFLKPNIKYECHPHLLTQVKTSLSKVCQACLFQIDAGTFSVRCFECELNFHVQCGSASLDKREKIKHFSHDHFLFPVVEKMNDDSACYACKKLIQDQPSYGCDHCEHCYLHKSCAKLPRQIQHRLHQAHPLILKDIYMLSKGTCSACHEDLDGLTYHCGECDYGFNLDLDCASQHPSIKSKARRDDRKYHEDGENVGHYSHYHYLTLLEVGDMECKLCHKNIHGPSYGCTSCMFYIHKSCAELPQEVRFPFHQHPCLKLHLIASSEKYSCVACGFDINSPGICYTCDKYCKLSFSLHPECVPVKPNVKYEGHQHLLILVENMSYRWKQGVKNEESTCQACLCKIEGTFFVRCIQCQLNFHVQCGPTSLSPTVMLRHHSHPLILSSSHSRFSCGVCKKVCNPMHPSYSCLECQYYAHVRCAVTEIPKDEREKLRHFTHDHVLFLLEDKRNDDATCHVCERLIEADSAYACVQCSFYLHKSCSQLPKEMNNLLHRHRLTAKIDDNSDNRQCHACQRSLNGGLTYQCQHCGFILDVDCAAKQLQIEFQGGDEHILTFFEKVPHSSWCKFTTGGSSYKCCLKCNFNLQLLHSPLPQAIEIESHHHLLALLDSHDDSNYDKQVCDVCEEERDPEECVYYCEECDFVAEVGCVVSEVILALQTKFEVLELRTINRKIADKAIYKGLTIQDVIDSIIDKERQEVGALLRDLINEVEEIRMKFSEDRQEATVSISKKFPFLDEDFLQLTEVYQDDLDKYDFIEKGDLESEVINGVKGYKTIPKLAGVLKNLLNKYGDIGAGCTFSQGTKSVLLFWFCSIVQSMCNTMIKDITNELILSWWRDSILLHRAGIKVDFVFGQLKRIMKARREGDFDHEFYQISPIHYHHEEIVKLSEEIKEQSSKALEKMDQLSRQQQGVISSIRQETLRSKTEQMSKALKTLRMYAGTGLLCNCMTASIV